MMCAPATGCVLSRRESSASAGGQLEQPSLVNSSTITGAAATGAARGFSSARANPHSNTGIRNFFINPLGLCLLDSTARAKAFPLHRAIRRESDVLDLFFELQSETRANARFQIADDLAQLCRRPAALVANQIGMVVGHADAAVPYALRTHQFQKICRRHLAFPEHLRRHLLPDLLRELGPQQILENAAGAFHVRRILGEPDLEYLIGRLAQLGLWPRIHRQICRENNPVLVLFENALAIAELALRVSDRSGNGSVEESHRPHALVHGMPVRAGIAIHSCPHRTRDAGHGLDSA